MGDAGAVDNDGIFFSVRDNRFEGHPFVPGELELGNAIVEREVDPETSLAAAEWGKDDASFILQTTWADIGDKCPAASGIVDIDIDAADAGRGHMRHREAVRAQRPAKRENGCVGLKVAVNASGVAAQIPDAFGDTTFCDVREAGKRIGGGPALTTHRERLGIHPSECALHQLLLLQLQDMKAALTRAEDDITEATYSRDSEVKAGPNLATG